MTRMLQMETTILPGHRIEIQSPDLPEGRSATIVVLVEDAPLPKRPLRDILADYRGGQLFRSVEEVDKYLREERETWDK